MGAAKGIVVASFIMFTMQFLSALVLGRAFCGWLCPAAGIQEACFSVQDKTVGTRRADWIKWLIWIPWIAIIIMTFTKAGGLKSVKPLYMFENGISVNEPQAYIMYFFVVGIFILLSLLIGRRAFCHYGCWMAPFMIIGRKIRNIFKWPSLHLKSNKEKCIDCKACTKACPMSLDPNTMVRNSNMENVECVLCGNCIDVCPKDAIKYGFGK
ncbi:MAG: 4Fe-4S binding protein [Sedimentisphaerales bacterium]|nr:4Fe-4S binding protein [Sedimentisphaerales bacterium]